MSPEEKRKERLAQLVCLTAFAAMVASAVGGMFWAAARDKESEPSAKPDLTEQKIHELFGVYNQKNGLKNNRR